VSAIRASLGSVHRLRDFDEYSFPLRHGERTKLPAGRSEPTRERPVPPTDRARKPAGPASRTSPSGPSRRRAVTAFRFVDTSTREVTTLTGGDLCFFNKKSDLYIRPDFFCVLV